MKDLKDLDTIPFPTNKELKFVLEAVIERTEILCSINGVGYTYLLDGALLDQFRYLFGISPGKALVYLKSNCYLCERRSLETL